MLFSGKENVFRCLAASEIVLPKINFDVWFVQTFYGKWLSFYRKSIFMFGLVKHFTENDFCFTENQFPCLVRSNILLKMEFVFYGKSIPMFGLWIILRKIWNSLQFQAPALPKQTCNSTKIFIHFNIKNNHPNSSICIA